MTGHKSRKASALALGICLCGAMVTCAGTRQGAEQLPDRATAIAVFGHIKQLEGVWGAKSTKGWHQKQQLRVLAKGSAVSSESLPDDPRDSTQQTAPMLTVYYMDGDRLLLSHYCVAGNQPRMVATAISDHDRSVRFTFLDATNLASVNIGHMHSVVMTFVDQNHFSERWSWSQNGKEVWMETVTSERITTNP